MAENVTLARPYAEAAFQLAKGDSHALLSWSAALQRLALTVTQPEMQLCVGDPRLGPAQLSQLFLDVGQGSLSAEQENFVRVLVDNGRLAVLPEISELFEELKHNHDGVIDADITSAFAIDDTALQQLTTDLERKFGRKVQATVKLDASLIGGVRIAVGDEVIDASVRGKLAAMATALKN